jgi:hypothetical protein
MSPTEPVKVCSDNSFAENARIIENHENWDFHYGRSSHRGLATSSVRMGAACRLHGYSTHNTKI